MLKSILVAPHLYCQDLISQGYTIEDTVMIIKGLKAMPGVYDEYILDIIIYLGGSLSQQEAIQAKYQK
tara:strand:+ start:100 stop:303 length:204 start_codon:yes stop_codon:yes gene_type:complete